MNTKRRIIEDGLKPSVGTTRLCTSYKIYSEMHVLSFGPRSIMANLLHPRNCPPYVPLGKVETCSVNIIKWPLLNQPLLKATQVVSRFNDTDLCLLSVYANTNKSQFVQYDSVWFYSRGKLLLLSSLILQIMIIISFIWVLTIIKQKEKS